MVLSYYLLGAAAARASGRRERLASHVPHSNSEYKKLAIAAGLTAQENGRKSSLSLFRYFVLSYRAHPDEIAQTGVTFLLVRN